MTPTDKHLANVASNHAISCLHHTTIVPGEGWLCQTCDAPDFAAFLLDAFGRTDVRHFGTRYAR